MKATELTRWPELCKHLQEQGYTGYAEGDIIITLNPKSGKVDGSAMTVIDQWGKTHAVSITSFIDPEDVKPPSPQPLPEGYAPLDCK